MWPQNSRRRTIALALSVFLVFSLFTLSVEHRETIQAHATKWLKDYRYQQFKNKIWPPDHGLIDLYPLETPSSSKNEQIAQQPIRKDAHTLTTADDFHDHFSAVTTMSGMTYEEAKAGCDAWKDGRFVNLMFAPDDKWVLKPTDNMVIEGRRRQWQNWVQTQMIPWEQVKHHFSGRGLVFVGGNHNTLERIKVSIRALVKLGSAIPIEIHYWKGEISVEQQQLVRSLYPHELSFNDLSGSHNLVKPYKSFAKMPSYGFKPAALLNSRFAEPLLIDAG